MSTQPRGPTFFMVGAPKCATTAWVSYLSQNPRIAFGVAKEPHYFGQDLKWKRAITHAQYLDNYRDLADDCVVGDGSVLSLLSEQAAQRIHAFNPQARILILLRDHLAFLRSYHNEMLYHGVETETSLETAWALSTPRQSGEQLPRSCPDARLLDYPRSARFAEHVQRFLTVFPPEQVCVLWLDDWTRAPADYFRAVQTFIGVSPIELDRYAPVGEAKQHRNALIARLLNLRPPAVLMTLYHRLRQQLGLRGRNQLLYRLRQANLKQAEVAPVSTAFATRIAEEFHDDREFVLGQAARSRRLLGLG